MNPLDLFTVSRVRTYNTCPRQHQYRYVLGWSPKDKAEALSRGTKIHEQLAQVYLETDKDSLLALWHWKHDDLVAVSPITASVERPLIVNEGTMTYAGVLDLIAINRTSGKFWVTDHKSVERMYPYPVPYAVEQTGVYKTLALLHGMDLDFAGGCISRILYKPDVTYQYALGYVLRNLKVSEGSSMTRTHLKQWENAALPTPPRKIRGKIRWLRHRKRQRSLTLRRYDADNQLVKSLVYLGDRHTGSLIHVERIYIPISSRLEKQNWKDFTRSVEIIASGQDAEHRTPGFHCGMCPFNVACPTEQREGLACGAAIDQDLFEQRPPNEEVLLALDKATDS